VVYTPDSRALDHGELQITATGIEAKVVKLSGQGVGPALAFTPLTLDFGFVPVGESKPMTVRIDNSGEIAATLNTEIVPPASAFSTATTTFTIAAGSFEIVTINFTPSTEDTHTGQLQFSGTGIARSIDLIGVGAKRGLVIDHAEVNFGDVRVGRLDTQVIEITCNVPLTQLEEVRVLNSADASYFAITPKEKLPFEFVTIGYKLKVSIVFSPDAEREFSAVLQLRTAEQTLDIPLKGRGVEAHIVTVEEIDFGVAELEVTTQEDLTITNAGLFPLTVTSASASLPFDVSNVSMIIAPGTSETIKVGFTPLSMKEVVGELLISSDAAEGVRIIRLRGKGGDGTQSAARIRYGLPDEVRAVIGEIVTIPVRIEGNKLEQFTSDSFYLELRFDPWMLHITGINASNSVTSGLEIESKKIDDSTYAISGHGASFDLAAGEPLIEIKGEALFGPRERTMFGVVAAYPSTASSITDAVSVFHVTNCQDQTAAAIYKGAYAVEQAFPTPTNNTATIAYTLGFHGAADIEIIDDLGRTLKRVSLPERPKGDHTFTLDVSELPNGHYSGLFRSREFLKRIDLIVQH
jgi:hypothetical protein